MDAEEFTEDDLQFLEVGISTQIFETFEPQLNTQDSVLPLTFN